MFSVKNNHPEKGVSAASGKHSLLVGLGESFCKILIEAMAERQKRKKV